MRHELGWWNPEDMHHMYGNWGTSWDWLWMTLMILFSACAIAAIAYWAGRRSLSHQDSHKPPAPPIT
jgi:hypothetical protein